MFDLFRSVILCSLQVQSMEISTECYFKLTSVRLQKTNIALSLPCALISVSLILSRSLTWPKIRLICDIVDYFAFLIKRRTLGIAYSLSQTEYPTCYRGLNNRCYFTRDRSMCNIGTFPNIDTI